MTEQLQKETLHELRLKALALRELIIKELVAAGSGHTAGPLGMADVLTAMYFHILRHDPKNPAWEERDRLVLSNGHIVPVQYAVMAMAGYFPIDELYTLRKINSRLQGHPHRTALPGLETTSGPLGSGLSQAAGIALSAKMDNKAFRVYCLTSDGEHEEGNTWEAMMFAGKNKLSNLTQIIDRNRIQIDGDTEDIMPLEPFKAKYEAFNWAVVEIDGNDIQAIVDAVRSAETITDKPTLILANTVPGKGVSFMENDYTWHGKPPTAEQGQQALEELEKIKENLDVRH